MRHKRLPTQVRLRALALLVTALGLAGSESRGQQLVRLLDGWPDRPPSALNADGSGPYWTRRARDVVVMERLSQGRIRELAQAVAPVGYPPQYFEPRLTHGRGAPELFYRKGQRLVSQNAGRLSGALGSAAWEYYGAARTGPNFFAAAFGIRGDGMSRVALIHSPDAPVIVTRLREFRVGVWALVALLSDTRAFVVYRGYLVAPQRGHGIILEAMDIRALKSQRRWRPNRRQWAPEERGYFYGDPSACLDEAGRPHFAAMIWDNRDQPTGRVVVDGIELGQRGQASYWLPQLTHVAGRGRVVAMLGENGAVQLGQVQGGQFSLLAEVPGREAGLASSGSNLYVSTSDGLWVYRFARQAAETGSAGRGGASVPAGGLGELAVLVACGLLAGSIRIRARGARGSGARTFVMITQL
jgi:hypothetical protein